MSEKAKMRLATLLLDLHGDLLSWLLRRPVVDGERGFGTTRENAVWPFLVLITLTTPIEIAAVELLLPRDLWWLRAALALAAVELLVLSWALYASLVRHPLIVGPDGLWLRWGAFLRHRLPYDLIEDVQIVRRRNPTGQFGMVFFPHARPEGYLTNSAQTGVSLSLAKPVLLPSGWFTRAREVQRLHLGVDDPSEFTSALNRARQDNSAGRSAEDDAIPDGASTGWRHAGLWLLLLSLALEGLLGLFGVLWIWQQGRELAGVVGFSWNGAAGGLTAGAAAFAVIIQVYERIAPRFGPLREWRKWMEEQLVPFLEPVGVWTALGISVSAGVGEELFFRGAMQPVIGLAPTALIFGLAHVGGLLRREAIPLFLFTLLFGLLGGWAYEQVSALWPLIVAHTAFDFLMILYLRRPRRSAAVADG
jgi:uncharacterized protein